VKIILDTNVFISGVFFGGLPYQILDAWRNGKLDIVLSEDIFNEYNGLHMSCLSSSKK